jgi:myo-inositol 2-dehydrogenase/D-chiro-inositol 1-dehydrogenase
MRIGIVGCGRMGRERARAAAALGVESILLADEDRQRAESLGSDFMPVAKVMADTDAVLDANPDAIFVCTPPFCRGPVENHAIDLGIPFFAEKPIGISTAQARSILDNLKKRSVLNAVGYMNRCRNSIAHVRSILQSRRIIGMSAHWIGKRYGVPWWLALEKSGGPFNEQATHLMDLFRYIAGAIEVLHASAHTQDNVETTVAVTLRLADGGLGNLLYSCEAKDKDILLSIETADGAMDLRGWELLLERNTIDGTYPEREIRPIFELETDSFLKAVATGNPRSILADFSEAYTTQLMMDKVNAMLQNRSLFERSWQRRPDSYPGGRR